MDEISYQIQGGRTLMTELGTVELLPGDLVRIPVGVAHDNYGRKASHILWYFPAPIEEVGAVTRRSEVLIPPFAGWQAATVNEVQVMSSAGDRNQIRWVFSGPQHAIGVTELSGSDGRTYTRHRNADDIQYQVAGTRLLVSANGSVELTPGTFVHIPVGVAYASITAGSSKHLTTVTTGKLTCVWEAAIESSWWSLEDIEAYRSTPPPPRPGQEIVVRRVPTPVTSTLTTSPGFRYSGGVRLCPTPEGVPVRITSPVLSSVNSEIVAISVGMEKISRSIVDSWTFSPLRTVEIRCLVMSTSSGVTRWGPSGVHASHALPCSH